MLLETLTGGTSYSGKKITAPIQGLGFSITGALSVAALKNITLEVNRSGSRGSKQIIYPISLWNAMQLKTQGLFRYNSSTFTLDGVIMLAEEACVPLDNSGFYTVNITGAIAGQTINMYGIEAPRVGDSMRLIEVNNLTSTSETDLGDLSEVQGIGFDYTKCTQVKIFYPAEGRTVIYLQNELKLIADQYNELVNTEVNGGTVKTGYDTILYLPLPMASQVLFTPNATVDVYMVKEDKF